ncbi:MAG: recombinase family protein [Sulfolobales archaeon]
MKVVVYARAFSNKQKRENNLDRQTERLRNYCSVKGYKAVDIVTDVVSELSEKRSGLQKLFSIVVKKQIDVIVVEFRDRLTRFGFEYLRRFFESLGKRKELRRRACRELHINNHKLRHQNIREALSEAQESKKLMEKLVMNEESS